MKGKKVKQMFGRTEEYVHNGRTRALPVTD